MESQEEFFNKLASIFMEEAKEHLKALSEGLLELEKELPQKKYKETIENIFREAHSLKGAARSVNQKTIQEICQSLENVFAILQNSPNHISSGTLDTLHATIEVIGRALSAKLDTKEVTETVDKLMAICERCKEENGGQKIHEEEKEPAKIKEHAVSIKETKPSEKTIRVSLQKLNRLFQEVEETLMIKLFFNQQLADLKQIMTQLRLQEKNLNSLFSDMRLIGQVHQLPSLQKNHEFIQRSSNLLEQNRGFLKTSKELLNKVIKNADQNAHFIGSMVDILLEDAKKILMQPIGSLFDAIPLMVRDIARSLSKDVQVEIIGGEIEVDRRVLEEIKDPVTHLIRNAIDHGIERADEREREGKPRFGTIKISSTEREGHNVGITISDDGKGIDIKKLKETAIQKGIISQKEASNMAEDEAIRLAFHSDISTSPIITELSGRGLGLGIVSEKVDKLGGQIQIESKAGQGTSFSLILPLTLATFRGVHIVVADQEFIVPTHNVKRVIRIRLKDIKRTENKETIILEDQSFSFTHLADLLGLTKKKQDENQNAYFFGLVIKAAEQTIVFGADSVRSECEILVKSLGSQCIRMKNVMAATVMEKGNVIPVLNPSDLIKSAIKGENGAMHLSRLKNTKVSKKFILLVEDSITTRMLLKNILTTAAYEVKTAVDGVEAFELLQSQNFDLILTDVEMPRMNGFALTEKVRTIEKFKDIPIIMCTALGSREDRERGIELGANAYLDKNNFNQQVLLNIVQKLI